MLLVKDARTGESWQGREGAELLPLAQPQLPKPQAVPFSLNFIVTIVYNCLQFLVHEFHFFGGGGKSRRLWPPNHLLAM